MTKEDVIRIVSEKIKLIRVEKDYSQDKMADCLGVSKKTLVQIEKGRIVANWTVVVAVVALFQNSSTLRAILGNEPLEVIETIAHDFVDTPKELTMGGLIWWKEVKVKGKLKLQQNIVSKHYRILDDRDYRWYSTFNEEDALKYIEKLGGRENE